MPSELTRTRDVAQLHVGAVRRGRTDSSGHTIGQSEHPEYRFDTFDEGLTDDHPIEVVESGSIFDNRSLVACSPSEAQTSHAGGGSQTPQAQTSRAGGGSD